MNICVIIPAAGASKRYAEGAPAPRSKLEEDLGGRPVLHRAVELFADLDRVRSIVVAGPHDDEAFADFKLRHGDKFSILGVTLCRGGATHRYETVLAALEHVPDDATHIAVHDAARPVTPALLIERVFDAAEKYDAVVPGLDVGDTIKRVSVEEKEDDAVDPLAAILGETGKKPLRVVEETVNRERLVAVQTPQVFRADLLRKAYAQDDLGSTDDAGLVERLGQEVIVVEGDARNIKITTPTDLPMARAVGGYHASKERAAHKRF